MKTILYILTFLLSTFSIAQNETLFSQGNDLYNDGHYIESIEKYKDVLKSGNHSAELYFNLGNAYYKLNNIAPSIYYYEKALQLAPNDKDILNNIAFARNMTIDVVDTIPEVGFSKVLKNLTYLMSFDNWAKTAVSLVILFVILFLSYYFSYTTIKKRLAFVGSLTSVVLASGAIFLAFHNYNLVQQDKPAIVFAKEAQIKSEPNLRSTKAFKLHEGTKVQILDTVHNWKKIKLADGKTGWIVNDDIKAL
ncbi:tetratricopeptide repeat protein [Flavobacteriaceae bacterium LMO-SS05]